MYTILDKLARHIHKTVAQVVYTFHGFLAYLVVDQKKTLKDGKTPSYRIVPVKKLEEFIINREFNMRFFSKYLDEVIRVYEALGCYLVTTKFHTGDDKYNSLLFVHKEAPFGSFLNKIGVEARNRYYEEAASELQYLNQPTDKVALGVPVYVHEGKRITVTIKDVTDVIKKKIKDTFVVKADESKTERKLRLRDRAEGQALLRMNPSTSVTVKRDDGQGAISPKNPLWKDLPKEPVVKGQGLDMITVIKVISKLQGNPLVQLKCTLPLLSWKQWKEICSLHGLSSDYKGIITPDFNLKNKVKFELGSNLVMDVGYHSDNRPYDRTQIVGIQFIERAENLESAKPYLIAVRQLLKRIGLAMQKRDIPALIAALSGVAKVCAEDVPFHGNVLKLLAVGMPLALVNNIETMMRNMVFRRIGRPKVPFSTRVLPMCGDPTAFKILQCGLTPHLARKMRASVGDTIVIARSPKASGFPAMTCKVISIEETCFTINPVIYALFSGGDFDGDTVALYRNEGIVKCRHSFIHTMSVLFEDRKEYGKVIDDTFNEACRVSSLPSKSFYKGLHPAVGSLVQMILAKRLTGQYDRLASKCKVQKLSNAQLRVIWNNVVQKTITNMKHVGDSLALGFDLLKQFSKLFGVNTMPVLSKVRYLLSGNQDEYANAHLSEYCSDIVEGFDSLDFGALVDESVDYAIEYREAAIQRFNQLVNKLEEQCPEMMSTIFEMCEEGEVRRFSDNYSDRIYADHASFKRVPKQDWSSYLNSYCKKHEVDTRALTRDDRQKIHSKFMDHWMRLERHNHPFGFLLNVRTELKKFEGTMSTRFQLLQDEVLKLDKQFGGNHSLDIWEVLYCNAITDKYRRWLLTNTVSDEVDVRVMSLVRSIAQDVNPEFKETEIDDASAHDELIDEE